MSYYSNSVFTFDSLNTLDLLPCTMKNGVFITNVKWKIHDFCYKRGHQYFYSPELSLYDPIKNETIKIQLRMTKERPYPKVRTYQIEYKQDNQWKWYSRFVFKNIDDDLDFTAHFPNNIYYGSNILVDDLRKYLATIHGETIAFDNETLLIQNCSKETLLAFIDQEHNEDFIIECQGKIFKIKKIILQARSPVFETMLSNNNFKETQENRMVIKDCGSEIVEKMIEFFETDFVEDWSNFEVELYVISRKYLSESFMEFTRLPFVNSLTIENYPVLLEIVQNRDDKETKELMEEWYREIHQPRD